MQSLIGTERLHSSALCVCSQVFNANVFIMIMMLTMTMTMTMTMMMAMTKAMMMTMGTVQGRHHPTADGLSAQCQWQFVTQCQYYLCQRIHLIIIIITVVIIIVIMAKLKMMTVGVIIEALNWQINFKPPQPSPCMNTVLLVPFS